MNLTAACGHKPLDICMCMSLWRAPALQGIGIKQLSMAQLDVLEELHHAALSAIAARRMDLVGRWGYCTAHPLLCLSVLPGLQCRGSVGQCL
jgi:hypothetical protein